MSRFPMKMLLAVLMWTWGTQVTLPEVVLRITIPRRSELTPVQRLNRDGVEAVRRRQYVKATALFYKAYLYDPGDPFTLNNLGYVSELQGQLDRAHTFYALASEQGSGATIDRSNARQLEGKPMNYAFENLQDVPMRVNRMNVNAMDLIRKNRGFQAASLLREALSLDPQNPFTLNNLAVADEATGDYESALKEYTAAAESHSSEVVVVSLDRSWIGKSVCLMAVDSARRLEARMTKMAVAEVHAARLNLLGVAATNQDDWLSARGDFLRAYSLDPASAFSLNNRGYVAEKDGDLETAEFFYAKARKANDSGARVGLATDRAAEGKRLLSVATESGHLVDGRLQIYSGTRHLETSPIELTPRGNPSDGASGTSLETPIPAGTKPQQALSSVVQAHN